jgi:hypothetical protein
LTHEIKKLEYSKLEAIASERTEQKPKGNNSTKGIVTKTPEYKS